MYNIKINEGGHDWEKQNLITLFKGKKNYDVLKCKNCGIQGQTTSVATIALKGSYAHKTVFNCQGKKYIPVRIKIIHCVAYGKQFTNITDGSEHDVINPPVGYKNDYTGVWVMGMGEPVKVLADEFIPL